MKRLNLASGQIIISKILVSKYFKNQLYRIFCHLKIYDMALDNFPAVLIAFYKITTFLFVSKGGSSYLSKMSVQFMNDLSASCQCGMYSSLERPVSDPSAE